MTKEFNTMPAKSIVINRNCFRIEFRGRCCVFGNTDEFRFIALLVEHIGQPVSYAEIGEACQGDDFASAGSIRALKRRVVRKLRAAGMADLAAAIKADKEHYRLRIEVDSAE
jgi:hypothetical protein